jgi:hypothetical protein
MRPGFGMELFTVNREIGFEFRRLAWFVAAPTEPSLKRRKREVTRSMKQQSSLSAATSSSSPDGRPLPGDHGGPINGPPHDPSRQAAWLPEGTKTGYPRRALLYLYS